MRVKSIYELQPVLDNPVFEGFGSSGQPSFLGRKDVSDDFFPVSYDDWNWHLDKLATIWKPISVKGRVRPFNDYPCLDLLIPAFSQRAAHALQEFLVPNGELLPLLHPAGEYCAFNCCTVAEVLDHSQTLALWRRSQPQMTQSVDYFSIDKEVVQDLSVFRMREMPNRVFVSTPFVEKVHEYGLNGFHFVKVWPFPEGVDYRIEDKKRWKEGRRVMTPTVSTDIKAESLVICLPLDSGKLSKDEKKRISSMEDDLDAQLFTPTLDDPYFGSLEGKKTAKGITKLYLSCPDAEALFRKLSHWLKALNWQPRPKVLVRNVSFDDFSAGGREVTV